MPYIAKKKARFDREYRIGEPIPDAAVDPSRARSLIAMGRIEYIEASTEPDGQETEDAVEEGGQEPAGAAGEAGGVNAPGEDENSTGEAVGAAETKKSKKTKK